MSWLQVLKSRFPASQAAQELRWIQQELPKSQWQTAVEQRARLVPLQYILGSQPFGDLTIKCKPGVLIPRNDTEEWCEALKQVIAKSNGPKSYSVGYQQTGTCSQPGKSPAKFCKNQGQGRVPVRRFTEAPAPANERDPASFQSSIHSSRTLQPSRRSGRVCPQI
ncbi:hypothetical protein KL928_000183 [Ogataea angusta]|uniref:Uncharacterized protein n=1 Tax=Pichia angusta TaxID=870730 RepID=A0AAN6I8Y2_PICAN|nr:uncharacterized protein KL928_000183 [Ogataea angusta]KAG7821708.1 hypothetical protein KL928_000183 [Ogataea angusta]